MTFLPRLLSACVATVVLHTAAIGQSDALASKSLPLVFAVTDKIFAFSDISGGGQTFSNIDLFGTTPVIKNGTWPWSGGAQDGTPWRQSLLLRSDVQITDSTHVTRVASLYNDGKFSATDSLILSLKDSATTVGRRTSLTAMAVWHDTVILGFGRLGIAYATLKLPETGAQLFTDTAIAFSGFPSHVDTLKSLITCAWNRFCPVDTLRTPAAGLDSVVALSVDSSAPDSVWLLIATQSGLRRGLLGSRSFPHNTTPGISDSSGVTVQSLFVQPNRRLLWAFTETSAFFSADHGAHFHVPDSVSGLTPPSILKSDGGPPQVAFYGDTSFVNYNLKRPGLVAFERDSILRSNAGSGLISDVLIDAEDGLDITNIEGSLTVPAVVTRGDQSILAVGTTIKGLFYRRLDNNSTVFSNLNRLRAVKGSLNEVITYPTTGIDDNGLPVPVHIGYRLKKDGKVTITVFNYAMEKVRTVVKNQPRHGGTARSENPAEDAWDGKDGSGREVSVGIYYILVESDQSERGFGKTIRVRGRK